jgi:chorismate dehydratase
MDSTLTLAIWDNPAAAFLVSGLDSSPLAGRFEIKTVSQTDALDVLRGGRVDVALISTLDALVEHETVDVLPAVALSSWSYPLARVRLPGGLTDKPGRLIADVRFRQEAFLASLVLREHYRMMPEIAVSGEASDARLEVGSFDDDASSEDLVLDLGQEWFELSGYPMLWGVFAMRKGEVTPEIIEDVGTLVRTSDARRALWLQANESSPAVHEFFGESLRVGFDDLAVASLTELRQYLYYHDLLDDVTELPVVFLESEEDDEDEPDIDA